MHRALEFYKLHEGIDNHASCLADSQHIPGLKVMLMFPYGIHWSEAKPEDFLEVDYTTHRIRMLI